MTANDAPIGAPTLSPELPPGRPARAPRIAVGLAVALAILVGAWLVAGRSGLESVGRGGVNASLLPKVGEVAPNFATEDVFGNRVELSMFRGRPVWLMFWGSWCPPCRSEFPDVQRAYQRLEPEGVQLLGVAIDESPIAAGSYAAQNGATFLVLSDPDRDDTEGAYPLFNVPTHIFIDADGLVRSIVLSDMDEATALREARALLTPAADAG